MKEEITVTVIFQNRCKYLTFILHSVSTGYAVAKIADIILFTTLKPFVILCVKFVHFWELKSLMKRIFTLLSIFAVLSCNRNPSEKEGRIITVSIAPFKYFVEEIAGDDFTVNIMVPPGSNPHIYEPYPEQINKLRKSEAYISNGFLGFEITWLDRFYEINKTMVKLSVGDKIDPIKSYSEGHKGHAEGIDPHYWVSPRCAVIIASTVKELLCNLNPSAREKYESNYAILLKKLAKADEEARALFSGDTGRSFIIYHPNLAYLAKDYGLREIPVEFEGKEPPPSKMKELIDLARAENINTIFVQKEFDNKNAKVIAHEIGADVTVIDPLSEEWLRTTLEIINALHKSFIISQK